MFLSFLTGHHPSHPSWEGLSTIKATRRRHYHGLYHRHIQLHFYPLHGERESFRFDPLFEGSLLAKICWQGGKTSKHSSASDAARLFVR
jgi:hypothetical protein